MEEFEHRYRAVMSRDPRFDGWFFTAVTTTGVYCRPSCPARTPAPQHVRFYPSAAAAARAGFRACLRCRPDASPGSPEWNVRADVVGRAVRLIADGLVDREGVAGLSSRLGYGPRHLHRLLVAELGAGPLALARAQRVQAARILVETTDLPMADVAFASGFSSVRQFNDTVRAALGRPPTELRRRAPRDRRPPSGGQVLTLRLPYRRPLDAPGPLAFLGRRAVPGVEAWDGTVYARTMRLPHGQAWTALRAADGHVSATVSLADLRDLSAAVGRCRRMLDLDADPLAVDAALGADRHLGPTWVPGRRVPGGEGFETAVRAVVGQQVSTAGARSVLARLVTAAGDPLALEGAPPGLSLVFPSPEAVAGAPATAFAMPARRRATLHALAAAVADGRVHIDAGSDRAEVAAQLGALHGVGPWTVAAVAMRGLGDPDAFLPTDLGVRRGLETIGLPGDARHAAAAAERWRPYRSYAVVHLWAAGERATVSGQRPRVLRPPDATVMTGDTVTGDTSRHTSTKDHAA